MSLAQGVRTAAAAVVALSAGPLLGPLAAPASATAASPTVAPCTQPAWPLQDGPAPLRAGKLLLTPHVGDSNLDLVATSNGAKIGDGQGPLRLEHTPPQGGQVLASSDPAFLGDPGDPTWALDPDADLALGFGNPASSAPTSNASAVAGPDAPAAPEVLWRLTDAQGPGNIYAYTDAPAGAAGGGVQRLLGTGQGWPRNAQVATEEPLVPSWSFTAAGHYTFTLQATATLSSGGSATADQRVEVLVGPCVPEEPTIPEAPEPAAEPTGPAVGDQPDNQPGNQSRDPKSDAPARPNPSPTGPVAGVAPESQILKPELRQAPAPSQRSAPTAGDGGTAAAPRCPQPSNSDGTEGTAGAGGGTSDGAGAGPGGAGDGSSGTGGGTSPGNGGGKSPTADVVRSGHFDFGAVIENNRLDARVKDDRTQPPAWVVPSLVEFGLSNAAKAKVPSTAAYSFLGQPGDDVWILPQTQSSSLPWLGWNTQHETVRAQVAGPVKFTLDRLTGPGQLAVFLNDSFGGVGDKKFGTVPGFPRSFNVALNVHAHGNWAFTEPGTYRATMSQSARLKSGKAVSDTATLTFHVGNGSAGRVAARTASNVPPATHLVPTGTAVAAATPGASEASPESARSAQGRCARNLGRTGAPDVAGTTVLGALLLLTGAVAVASSRRATHRERATGR